MTVSGIGQFNSLAETCAATVLSSGAYKVGILLLHPPICGNIFRSHTLFLFRDLE